MATQEEIKVGLEELSPDMILFCEEYIKGLVSETGLDATKAYMAAYPGAEKLSARSSASRLLTKDNIKDYIAGRLATMVMSTDEALIRLGELSRKAPVIADRIRALDLVLKTKGVYISRSDITTGGKEISWNQFINSENAATENSGKGKITVIGE